MQITIAIPQKLMKVSQQEKIGISELGRESRILIAARDSCSENSSKLDGKDGVSNHANLANRPGCMLLVWCRF
jgi:hypothetical protein